MEKVEESALKEGAETGIVDEEIGTEEKTGRDGTVWVEREEGRLSAGGGDGGEGGGEGVRGRGSFGASCLPSRN